MTADIALLIPLAAPSPMHARKPTVLGEFDPPAGTPHAIVHRRSMRAARHLADARRYTIRSAVTDGGDAGRGWELGTVKVILQATPVVSNLLSI